MVGWQRVLVDNVRELLEGGGALSGGERVKSLWLECTAAAAHTHTHISLHSWVCEDCTEVSGSRVRPQSVCDSAAEVCLSVCSSFFIYLCVISISFSLSLSVSPLLVRLCSARSHSSTHAVLFTVFVSASLCRSSQCDRLISQLFQTHSMKWKVEQKPTVMGLKNKWQVSNVKPTWNMLPTHIYLFNHNLH